MVVIAAYRGRATRNPISRFLAWAQRSDYSHCAFVWDMREGEMLLSEATILGGVRTHWRETDTSLWVLYPLVHDADEARKRIQERHGWGYDVAGLSGFLWRRIKGGARRLWCSELVADVLGWPDPWRFDVPDVVNAARIAGAVATPWNDVLRQQAP